MKGGGALCIVSVDYIIDSVHDLGDCGRYRYGGGSRTNVGRPARRGEKDRHRSAQAEDGLHSGAQCLERGSLHFFFPLTGFFFAGFFLSLSLAISALESFFGYGIVNPPDLIDFVPRGFINEARDLKPE